MSAVPWGQQPVEVAKDGVDSIWLAESLSEPLWPRIVLMFGDGTFLCSCKRRAKGCRHSDSVMDERARRFAEQENFATEWEDHHFSKAVPHE